jgi:hypothetical protein
VSSAWTSRNSSKHASGASVPCSKDLLWILYPCLGLSPARKGPGRFSSPPFPWPGSCSDGSNSPSWASLRQRCFPSLLGTRLFRWPAGRLLQPPYPLIPNCHRRRWAPRPVSPRPQLPRQAHQILPLSATMAW